MDLSLNTGLPADSLLLLVVDENTIELSNGDQWKKNEACV
jgi:hypothetical protein